jgi:hypothetical protein
MATLKIEENNPYLNNSFINLRTKSIIRVEICMDPRGRANMNYLTMLRGIISTSLILGFLGSNLFAKETDSKAVFVTGEVSFQKKGMGDWKPLKVGAKIRENDNVRTLVESKTELEFNNGSKISIEENTIVEMSKLFEDGAGAQTNVNIKTGSLLFNIQKLSSSKSSFQFETRTATAAIRGTSGGFGDIKGKTFAFLENGSLDLKPKGSGGSGVNLGPLQFAFQGTNGSFFLKKLDSKEKLLEFLKMLKEQGEISDSLLNLLFEEPASEPEPTPITNCEIEPWPQIVTTPNLSIAGSCPMGIITAGPYQAQVRDGKWELNLAWPSDVIGSQSIPVVCKSESSELPCGVLNFEYKPEEIPASLQITSPMVQQVCNNGLDVSGSFSGNNPTISFQMGGKLISISAASGSFSKKIPLTDVLKNWNETELVILLTSNGTSIREVIQFEVDKTCKSVNTQPPVLNLSASNGSLLISAANGKDDLTKIQVYADQDEIFEREFSFDIRGFKVPLVGGVHNYRVVATDQAGNSIAKELSKVEYYPRTEFRIRLNSPTADRAIIRRPPPPPGSAKDFTERMEIRLENLPDDNYNYIQKIIVQNSAAGFRQEFRGTQINNIRYEITVPLVNPGVNTIEVLIEPKNGPRKVATKTITFR